MYVYKYISFWVFPINFQHSNPLELSLAINIPYPTLLVDRRLLSQLSPG